MKTVFALVKADDQRMLYGLYASQSEAEDAQNRLFYWLRDQMGSKRDEVNYYSSQIIEMTLGEDWFFI